MLLIKKIQTLAMGSVAVSSASAFASYLSSSKASEPQKEVVKRDKVANDYSPNHYDSADYKFNWNADDDASQI